MGRLSADAVTRRAHGARPGAAWCCFLISNWNEVARIEGVGSMIRGERSYPLAKHRFQLNSNQRFSITESVEEDKR